MNDATSLDYRRRPSAIPYMVRAMMPVSRHRDLKPKISAQWRGHHPDPRELAAFGRIAGLPYDATSLPLLYPHTFGFRLAMAILTHPRFPVPIWGVLQTRNHLLQHRPIAVGEPLDFEVAVVEGRAVPKGAEFDLRTTVQVEGTLVWESVLTFFARGRFGDPGPASPMARAPSEVGPPVGEWVMRDADHWRFGGFTGDYNGIHMWDWYAHRLGFRRALYHPPRVLGECLARLAPPARVDDGRRRLRLDAWLKGPVPHGATVRMHAATTPTASTFALFAGEDRPCIVGKLTVPEATG